MKYNFHFTFIDLIKGIVLKDLFDNVKSIVKSESNARDVICIFIKRLQNLVKDIIWSSRCDLMLEKERLAGINTRIKKQKRLNGLRTLVINNNYTRLSFYNYSLMLEMQLGCSFLKYLNHS